MNGLQVFNYNSREIRTVEKNGEFWWVAKDVCEVFGDTNYRRSISRLDKDEKGVSQIDTLGGRQQMSIVNESGLYSLLFYMQPQKGNLPQKEFEQRERQLKQFKRWVTHEVLPTIRKTGSYTIKQDNLEVKKANAKTRQAYLLARIADKYPNTTYQQVLHSHATALISGEHLLPLPALERRTYSATELAERLGVSANRIGKIANSHNLKTDEYGKWFHDKSRSSSKEVQSFRYFENVLPVLETLV